MPSASERIATPLTKGVVRRLRNAYLRSRIDGEVRGWERREPLVGHPCTAEGLEPPACFRRSHQAQRPGQDLDVAVDSINADPLPTTDQTRGIEIVCAGLPNARH